MQKSIDVKKVTIAFLLSPKYAVLTGLGRSIVSGMTFDIYSLYFAPVQISTGLIAGLMYQKSWLKGKKMPLGVLSFAVPTSLISAVIAARVFGGITSSGSSYIVQRLKQMGASDIISVLVTQIGTDYMDKYIAVLLVAAAFKVMPTSFKIIQESSFIRRKNG